MAQSGKLMPNLDQQGTKVLNLTVLQRIDPFIDEILITAAHVTLYEFNIDTSQWSRKDIEGSLFVVKRNTQPRFQFIVMNRRSADNLVENLLGDFEYEVHKPYLLYRNASQEVNGIWFYNSRECEDVANLFSRILTAYSKVPSKPKVSSTKSEFEELEAVPSVSVIEGPLEPPSTTVSVASNSPEDSSFENFFNSLNIESNPSNVGNSRPGYHSSPAFTLSQATGTVSSFSTNSQVSSTLPHSTVAMPVAIVETPVSVSGHRATNLVKPSSFLGSHSSSSSSSSSPPLVPPFSSPLPTVSSHSTIPLQRPYGTPMLQPFPPPAPPSSLTPNSLVPPIITREKVREALLMLIQDDRFVDMFHQALMKSTLS